MCSETKSDIKDCVTQQQNVFQFLRQTELDVQWKENDANQEKQRKRGLLV